MKVQRIGLAIVALIFLSACAQNKLDTVTQNISSKTGLCNSSSAERNLQENSFIVSWEDGHFSVENAENKDLFIEKFVKQNLAEIKTVEFNQVVRISDFNAQDVSPNNTVNGSQAIDTWGDDMIEVNYAWNNGIKGTGVSVAVIDAAIDYSHPQLSTRLAQNTKEVNGLAGDDDDSNGYIDDKYGWDFYQDRPNPSNLVSSDKNYHGSHVAGIILADPTQGPMKGVAPEANLVPINFMSAEGEGGLDLAIHAIKYAVSRGVKVINASWGGSCYSEALKSVIGSLESQGVLFVVASGNEGQNLDYYQAYPAKFNFPGQITVAATSYFDSITNFSNTSYTLVHIGAPGLGVYSTVPGGYRALDGTSMATPFVSGAAALLWSHKPQATVAQIKQAILSGVDVKSYYRVSTSGRLNVRKALSVLDSLAP